LTKQNEALEKISEKQQEIASDWFHYWEDFSSFSTWPFWFHVVMFVVPLIVLYFKLDRKKALELGFFGLNIHVWFAYFDTLGTRQGFWTYPFQMLPFLPNSVGLDASLVPVLFILLYQWVKNHNKNYYFYAFLLSLILSFGLKWFFVSMNLFKFHMGANYFHLFLTYLVILGLSKWIVDLFLHFQKEAQ